MATEAQVEAAAQAIYEVARREAGSGAEWRELLKAKSYYLECARAALAAAERDAEQSVSPAKEET